MEVSIRKILGDKYHYTQSESIQNIIDLMNKKNICGKGILTSIKQKIILKEQIGGVKKMIDIGNNVFEYHIDTITPLSNNESRICFMNIAEHHDNCACLLYNTKQSGKTTLVIEGLSNGEDCVKCYNKNITYKTGDILMLIILRLVEKSSVFSHITKIKLSDTSKKNCYNNGIELKYFKTITDGRTYYSKYSFRPQKTSDDEFKNDIITDYKAYFLNKEIFKKKRMISNNDLRNVILQSNLSTSENNFYHKYIKPYIDSNNLIDTSIFMSNILNLVIKEQPKEMDITNDIKKVACLFIISIYKNLYRKIGYIEYKNNIWTKDIIRQKI